MFRSCTKELPLEPRFDPTSFSCIFVLGGGILATELMPGPPLPELAEETSREDDWAFWSMWVEDCFFCRTRSFGYYSNSIL